MGRILVTGANGFVGKALVAQLSASGQPYAGTVRERASATDGHQIAIGDIDGRTDWRPALEGVSAIIHLANRAHVMHETAADPLALFRAINTDGTLNLARQAAAAGVRRFVFVSSIKVNGESTDGRPFTPEDPPAPTDPYGISKWEAEQALARLSQETGLEVVIVRPPLIYGPGVKANFLRLVQAIGRGMPLPFGLVRNKRSLVAVDNLCSALIACATHEAAAGHTFLVSDGQDLSTPELVRAIARGTGRPARLLPVPPALMLLAAGMLGKGEAARRVLGSLQVDASALQRVLGWYPPYSASDKLAESARHVVESRK